MSTRCLLIVIIPIIFSCRSGKVESHDLVGKYESKEYSQLELGWGKHISKEMYSGGSMIDLKGDSTFYYQSCGNIIKGDWKIKNDSLLLLVKSNRWRDDSLHINSFNGKQPEIPAEPVVYQIDGNLLRSKRKDTIQLEGKTYDSIEELVKVKPQNIE